MFSAAMDWIDAGHADFFMVLLVLGALAYVLSSKRRSMRFPCKHCDQIGEIERCHVYCDLYQRYQESVRGVS